MVLSSFKCTYERRNPKEVIYRDYKNFDNGVFRDELRVAMDDSCNNWCSLENRFLNILNNHAPVKKKTIRANHAPYMTKQLRKAIMRRTELANKYHKSKNEDDFRSFKKQKNYVNRLYKKEKKHFYSSLSVNDLKDNKLFWKTMKPLLSDKSKGDHKITLVKGDKIISKEDELAEEFGNFFSNAVKNLNIPDIPVNEVSGIHDQVDKAILKYKDHPSILKINEMVPSTGEVFGFHNVSEDIVLKKVRDLNITKSTTFKNIPGKVFKDNVDVYYGKLTEIINHHLETDSFPDTLKFADVYPVFKKDVRTDVEHYRPVSVLSYASKVFERIIHDQVNIKMNAHLSKNLCGYRKGFSTQHALITMLEKWRKSLDDKGFGGAVLMDLSKAFDCMNHELLLAKMHAYGFGKSALKTIHSYLTNRWQRVKINYSFSSWEELLLGVPQGSVLGPLLFKVYLTLPGWGGGLRGHTLHKTAKII